MAVETELLLSPIGEVEAVEIPLAPRLDSLAGKRAGFLDNGKVHSGTFQARMQQLLTERFGFSQVIARKKPIASKPTPEEMLNELARGCDFVVHAFAD